MGNGLQNGFEKEFFQAGALNMYVSGTRTSETYAGYQKGRQINLKNSVIDYVVENYTDKYEYISGVYNQMMTVKLDGESSSYTFKGVSNVDFYLINIDLDIGL